MPRTAWPDLRRAVIDWRMGPGDPFPDGFDPETDTINGRRTDPVNGKPWSYYYTDTTPRRKETA